MKLLLWIVIAVSLFVWPCNDLTAQVISFRGIEARSTSDIPVEVPLDSIRIRTNNNRIDTTLYGVNIIDLSLYSSVPNSYNPEARGFNLSNCSPSVFDQKTRFKVNQSKSGYVEISLYNISGILFIKKKFYLDEGGHEFYLYGSGISNGLYNLVVSNGLAILSTKLIKQGGVSCTNVSIEYLGSANFLSVIQSVEEKEYFILTGYSGDFIPVALDSIVPENGKQYDFGFYDYYAVFNVAKVQIEISNIKIARKNEITHWDIGNSSSNSYRVFIDTFNFNLKLEIVDRLNINFNDWHFDGNIVINCEKYRTKDSIIGLCYEDVNLDYDWQKGRSISLNCIIDTNLKKLRDVSFEYDMKGNYVGGMDGSLTTINFHYTKLTIPSVNYLIDNQGNLVVEIKGDKILEMSAELSDHYNDRRYSGAYDDHEERWARGILEDNPDAVIKFKFIRKIF